MMSRFFRFPPLSKTFHRRSGIVLGLFFFAMHLVYADVLYYAPFDNTVDMSTQESQVQIDGITTGSYMQGRRGQALLMDKDSSRLSYRFPELMAKDGCLELWFRPLDWDAVEAGSFKIIITTTDGKTITCVKNNESSNIYFSVDGVGSANSFFAPAYHVRKNQWQQLVVVRSGNEMFFYLNGEPASDLGECGKPKPCRTEIASDTLLISFDDKTLIDELRIYNRAFDAVEIEERHIMARVGRVNYRPPIVTIPYTKTAPSGSGRIDCDSWSNAAVVSDFVHMRSAEKALQQTWVHLMYDDEKVYLLFRSPVFENGLSGGPRERDTLSGGDEIEFFVMPEYTETFDFYQFIGNPWESIFDSLRRDRRDWQGDWLYRCKVDQEWWNAELWINDYSAIGTKPPVSGQAWTANFCRNWRSGSEAGAGGGWTQWAQTSMGYHTHNAFGTLIFGGVESVIVRIDTISSISEEQTSAIFSLANPGCESRKIVVRYEFYPAGDFMPLSTSAKDVSLAAGESKNLTMTCSMGEFFKGLVELQAVDAASGAILFRQMINIDAKRKGTK